MRQFIAVENYDDGQAGAGMNTRDQHVASTASIAAKLRV